MNPFQLKKIENGIRAIRMGNKTPQEANINESLERLKKLNEGMYLDLNNKYVNVVKDYNTKK